MDPFATLGFDRRYDLDKAELERRYRDLQSALHPDKHTGAPASQRSMTLHKAIEVNEAYRVLRDDTKRAEALFIAMGGKPNAEPADPELLMEMMELREALADARTAGASERVRKLGAQVGELAARVRDELTRAFATQSELARVQALLGRLRYYQRFLDEVAIFEDEALG
jgi:molecular chaperone HscB